MDAFLADLVVAIHLAVVVFMILGIVLVLVGWPLKWRWIRNPWFRLTHLGIMGYIVVTALRGEYCFLTTLETDLRRKAGQWRPDDRSFVGGLLHDILFVDVPQSELNRIYFVVGVLVLVTTVCVRPRFGRSRAEESAAGRN